MKKVYFKVLISDLTEDILSKSLVKNPYKTNRSTDGKYLMLSFKENVIPLQLLKLGYSILSLDEAKIELNGPNFDLEINSALVNNFEDKDIIVTSQPPFSSKTLPDGKKLYARTQGKEFTLVAGANTLDFSIPYPTCKITGVEIINGELGDKVDLFILDDPSGTYSTIPNDILNQFGFDTNIAKDFYKKESHYDADLYINMNISITYYSQSAKNIYINYLLHEVKV